MAHTVNHWIGKIYNHCACIATHANPGAKRTKINEIMINEPNNYIDKLVRVYPSRHMHLIETASGEKLFGIIETIVIDKINDISRVMVLMHCKIVDCPLNIIDGNAHDANE